MDTLGIVITVVLVAYGIFAGIAAVQIVRGYAEIDKANREIRELERRL